MFFYRISLIFDALLALHVLVIAFNGPLVLLDLLLVVLVLLLFLSLHIVTDQRAAG